MGTQKKISVAKSKKVASKLTKSSKVKSKKRSKKAAELLKNKNRRLFIRKRPPKNWSVRVIESKGEPYVSHSLFDVGTYGFSLNLKKGFESPLFVLGKEVPIVFVAGSKKFSVYARLHYVSMPIESAHKMGRAGFEFIDPSNELVFFLSDWIAK